MFLEHIGHLVAQRVDIDLLDVSTVEQHATGIWTNEPGNQVRETGLACAGRTDNGDQFTRPQIEIDALERLPSIRIGEVDSLYSHTAGKGPQTR